MKTFSGGKRASTFFSYLDLSVFCLPLSFTQQNSRGTPGSGELESACIIDGVDRSDAVLMISLAAIDQQCPDSGFGVHFNLQNYKSLKEMYD